MVIGFGSMRIFISILGILPGVFTPQAASKAGYGQVIKFAGRVPTATLRLTFVHKLDEGKRGLNWTGFVFFMQ